MKTAAPVALLFWISAAASCGTPKSVSRHPTPDRINQLRQQANSLVQQMQYRQAAQLFETAYREAKEAGDLRTAVRLLMNVGNCHFSSFRYLDAIRIYHQARQQALEIGDAGVAAALLGNISSLYLQLGDTDSAKAALEEALQIAPAGSPYRGKLYLQAAVVRARRGETAAAREFFGHALHAAEDSQAAGDLATKAEAWEQLGYTLLGEGRYEEAEQALTEAFRVRKLFRLPELQYSYYTLGLLRLRQGRAAEALRFFDEARARTERTPGALPRWRLWFQRGLALAALGRSSEAIAEFEAALEAARRWRLELLSADSARIGAEGELHDLHTAYVAAVAGEYFRTGRLDLAARAFATAEENRAASLRALLTSAADWQRRLPPIYWEQLARVRLLEAELARRDTPEIRRQLGAALYRLTEMEAASGKGSALDSPAVAHDVQAVQRRLGPQDALLSFQLAQPHSYLWILTRDRFEMRPLAPREDLEQRGRRFAEAVRAAQPAWELGFSLYDSLFGGLPPDVARKSRWFLTLDGKLYDVPLAALVTGFASGRPVYLVERHVISVVPAASLLEGSGLRRGGPGLFVGFGDGIYNRADPRRRDVLRREFGWSLWPRLTAATPPGRGPELPRLVGSGRELEHCIRIWQAGGGDAVLLEGAGATREALTRELRRRPQVLHLATHTVETKYPHQRAHLFLGLRPNGDADLFTPAEIARLGLQARLVVLSGCGSGRAAVLPSTGLMGLARAWLSAGAGAVLATLWPTPDDTGEFFAGFYRGFQGGSSPAEALREAQLAALRSGTWRARPGYWAAYFVVGKE